MTELEKFKNSLKVNIKILNSIDDTNNMSEKEKDDLKMRHISKLFDKFYKRKFIYNIPLDVIIKNLKNNVNDINNIRTKQMFEILIFYVSDKTIYPNKIKYNEIEKDSFDLNNPIVYCLEKEENGKKVFYNYDKDLEYLNIFISKGEFNPIKNNLV